MDVGLNWLVVESLLVYEEIKIWLGVVDIYLENYKRSLCNLGVQGIKVVIYNFMLVLDWIWINIFFRLLNGVEMLRFDCLDFMVFDLYMFKCFGVQVDYS